MSKQHIHILGIGGTFMGGVAQLAKAKGFKVTGSDGKIYPPMSTQLEQAGIEVSTGYDDQFLQAKPDCVVIGNALSRGNAAVEAVLNQGIPYCSGPEWLAREILQGQHVIAIAGTHGKTTVSSMIAWLLESQGLQPGFLIGGVPQNFNVSARLGAGQYFVVEADEYDSAFFDKRSKFVHYHPSTLVLNNLEFDHADIFENLAAIERQFHHLVRTVPGKGRIIVNQQDQNLKTVLNMGLWTPVQSFGTAEADLQAELIKIDGSAFYVQSSQDVNKQKLEWSLLGQHNVNNALAAISAVLPLGIDLKQACQTLSQFQGVARRLQVFGKLDDIVIYDDFAHHPTAIATTLNGLRARGQEDYLIAVFEPRSNSFKMGIHQKTLAQAFSAANAIYAYEPAGLNWSLASCFNDDSSENQPSICSTTEGLLEAVATKVNALKAEGQNKVQIVIMSNGGFEGLHGRLLQRLQTPVLESV